MSKRWWNGARYLIINLTFLISNTAQKMKFSIKDLFSKCDQISRNLRIWSHLLKKSLMEIIIFYAVLLSMPFLILRFGFYSTDIQQKESDLPGYLGKKKSISPTPQQFDWKLLHYSIKRVSNTFRLDIFHKDFKMYNSTTL